MTTSREKTSFHGLNIVHPHSGKVSASVVARIVKHLANGYSGQSNTLNAEKLIKEGIQTVILKDHNGKIELDYTSVN